MIDEAQKNKILKEKKRIQRQCVSLECQAEQLKLLIERLNTISTVKENEIYNASLIYNQKAKGLKNNSESEALSIVQKKKTYLENCVSELKSKMDIINKLL